jgi:AAHS family 4-hydroxybenzoate transporter-like MFS transporter
MDSAAVPTIDVATAIDNLPIGRFHVKLLAWCCVLVLTDGYDISVIGFAGPSLVREWHIANIAVLAPAFSAGLVGLLFGAPLFGYLGDRFGRKTTLIACAFLYGVLSLITAAASSLEQMVYLRFLTGIALGGVTPTAFALAAEFAPKRFRLTFGMIVGLGLIVGAGLPGIVAATLVPTYGWQALFLVGGVTPILVASCLIFVLPESLKFLSLRPSRRNDAVKLLSRVRPDLHIGPDTRFVVASESEGRGLSVKDLFAGGLAVITPLLWFLFMVSQMSMFFFQTWMPTLVASAGLPMTQAALSFTWFQLGGLVGNLTLSRPFDKFGLALLTIVFLVSVPVVATLGIFVTSRDLLMLAAMVSGFCLLGLVSGLVATASAIYPTRYRSMGIGWAYGMGRLGGVGGPLIGGFLVSLHLPNQQLFLAASVPLVFGTAASLALACFYFARHRKFEIDEAMASS